MSTETSSPPLSIVVGVDGSPSGSALQGAVRSADSQGAEIDAARFWEYPTSFGWAGATPLDRDPAAYTADLTTSARLNNDCSRG